jgi:ATP-dependent Clp protease ATP-binding subunit ClpB
MMPGEFEERLKAVTSEIEASGRRIILFIDDIHNLVPSPTQASGSMSDGSAILKPALAKGTLRCLGCSRCARAGAKPGGGKARAC